MRLLLAALITIVLVLYALSFWYGKFKRPVQPRLPQPPRPFQGLFDTLGIREDIDGTLEEARVELQNAQEEMRDAHAELAAEMARALTPPRTMVPGASFVSRTTRSTTRTMVPRIPPQSTPAPQAKLDCGCPAPTPPKVRSRFDLMDDE